MRKITEFTEANRVAWNEAMHHHQAANKDRWDVSFADPAFTVITGNEFDVIRDLCIEGKSIVHPCCNNGIELMSLKRMGAAKCVGFDISDEAILEARTRADKFEVECEFHQSDVYSISSSFDNQFDMIYISIGCFGWMPDLEAFIARICGLLKAGGVIFIHEQHPFSEMLSSDDDNSADPLKIIEPYFKADPYVDNEGIDYVGKVLYESKSSYWFVWTLSDIFMALIKSGINIQLFNEYTEDISANHSRNQKAGIDIPLSYILIGEKS